MDIIVSFVLAGIFFHKNNHPGSSGHGMGALLVFGSFGVVYIVIVVYYINKWKTASSLMKKAVTQQGILIGLGGLCYYVGDNLPPIIVNYADELGCGQECVRNIRIAGAVLLGTASVTYLPILVDGVFPRNTVLDIEEGDEDEEDATHVVVFLLLAKSTNMDLMYTAIERIASRTQCVLIGGWVLWGIYFLFFTPVTVYGMCKYEIADSKKKCALILAVITGVLITVFAACYTLADNRNPLGCSGNNIYAQDVARLCLWSGSVITGVLVFWAGTIIFEDGAIQQLC